MHKKQLRSLTIMHYDRGEEIAVRGPNVARHSISSGPRKRSWKIFKSVIFSNLPQ